MPAQSHNTPSRKPENARIKPSIRLHPPTTPFPPPGVHLHPQDASSAIFLAIGRALMSVDNRAMTIKDLADLTVAQGFVCQNVSAASQAITTYIRGHMSRVEEQDDHPLLLKHTLSGTPDDDDLLAALHSTGGGAHPGVNTGNQTNFRRGTSVWYLSGATGAPCPFARAGIMLCEYGDNGRVGSQYAIIRDKKKTREPPPECGSKRKRSLRGAHHSDSDSSPELAAPPPKVKLTLRLKPLRAFATTEPSAVVPGAPTSEEESDAEQHKEEPWSLPPYPRRSISIPCCNQTADGPYYYSQRPYQRSSSVPYSPVSPPPDSEDDNDDFHISMTASRRASSRYRARKLDDDESDGEDWDADEDDDSEGDGETMWESPGPRSPSAPAAAEIEVKQEPGDFLDEEVILGLPSDTVKVKLDEGWEWQHLPWAEPLVKQEEDLESLSLSSSFEMRDPGPSSPLSPLVTSPLIGFESVRRSSDPLTDPPDVDFTKATLRPRSRTVPALSDFFSAPVHRPQPPPLLMTQTLTSLIESMSVSSPAPCISPHDTRCDGWSTQPPVVHTSSPSTPAISATQVEGIPVYQTTLGTQTVLRRLDTDFVNLSPYRYLFSNTVPHPSQRHHYIAWLPDYHPLRGNPLKMFLSDRLASQFPSNLTAWKEGVSSRGVFGQHFASTVQATTLCSSDASLDVDDTSFLTPLAPSFSASAVPIGNSVEPEQPLSSTEQQIFQELCITTEWDGEMEQGPPSPLSDVPSDGEDVPEPSSTRNLRRSKRVADAKVTPRPIRGRGRGRGGKRRT
ncbi:hypothetical protein MKEN_01182300 [Mycena kentingensis (nom. inval.)]|nr:hypothetical protein MKEN_01182300 [Mycena kentingensis (nom. inval.)]